MKPEVEAKTEKLVINEEKMTAADWDAGELLEATPISGKALTELNVENTSAAQTRLTKLNGRAR